MPGGDPFDLIGAMAMLREANFFLETSGRPDLVYDYEVVSNQPGTVFEAEGLSIVVDKACYDIRGDVDTVVFQAVDYEGKCLRDQRFLAWIRRISKGARRMVTACLGTYVLAEAGLLDGRRAATHWGRRSLPRTGRRRGNQQRDDAGLQRRRRPSRVAADVLRMRRRRQTEG